jgi:hypothetical protein
VKALRRASVGRVLGSITALVFASVPGRAQDLPKQEPLAQELSRQELPNQEPAKPESAKPERLKLSVSEPIEITCETKSVAVAPEAKTSAGSLRLKLLPKDASATSVTGTWSILDASSQHAASFALLQATPCKEGCPLHALTPPSSTDKTSVELWAPQRATLDGVPATTLLTVAALDLKALTLRVSSFLDKQIAVLEQGDCKVTK